MTLLLQICIFLYRSVRTYTLDFFRKKNPEEEKGSKHKSITTVGDGYCRKTAVLHTVFHFPDKHGEYYSISPPANINDPSESESLYKKV